MSTALLDQLRCLADSNNWDAIVAAKKEILAMTGPAAERARALLHLGRAHWNRAHAPNVDHDPWDLTLSVRYARQALELATQEPDLQGRIMKTLGTRLVTIGRYADGRRILKGWLARNCASSGPVDKLAEVQYAIGYSYRYEGDFVQAELWYTSAQATFLAAGNTDWVQLSGYALVQVLARQGRTDAARDFLLTLPHSDHHEAYRLKAWTEILAAEDAYHSALNVGEQASEALLELAEFDPWELAEIHLLLADLQARAGDLEEKAKHLDLAMDLLRTSPRHDLYKVACMLLDYERKEVTA